MTGRPRAWQLVPQGPFESLRTEAALACDMRSEYTARSRYGYPARRCLTLKLLEEEMRRLLLKAGLVAGMGFYALGLGSPTPAAAMECFCGWGGQSCMEWIDQLCGPAGGACTPNSNICGGTGAGICCVSVE